MFEYDQDVVQVLLEENSDFKRMYDKHHQLKEEVHKAEHGEIPMTDFALENLKKEKLLLKDKMAALIYQYRHA